MRENLENICERVCEVAREAGAFIARERETFDRGRIEHKGAQNLVSYVDKGAEKLIIERLSKILPEAKFLAEESSVGQIAENPEGEYLWVIDPLDGTTNFIHAMPPYAVSLALMYGSEVVVGVIYEVTRDECFSAYKGSRSKLNGKDISVSEVKEIEDSLVITGVAYSERGADNFERAFEYFNRNSNGTRRIGSAAANLAYVAAGRAECFFQCGLEPWDVAAGVLLVENSGGVVKDYDGGRDFVFSRTLIATNKNSHLKFYSTICKKLF